MNTSLAIVILAAGRGTRMKSALPKVLHTVAGLPMLLHVVRAAEHLKPEKIIVVSAPDLPDVTAAAAPHSVALQHTQRGTGDAVRCAMETLNGFMGDVLVLFGDVPLVTADMLQAVTTRRAADDKPAIVVVGFRPADATGYGRLVMNEKNELMNIVEHKDANDTQREIGLCNSGMMLFDGAQLPAWLAQLQPNNAQGEYYLTDCIALARANGAICRVVETDADNVRGVNSRADLAAVETIWQNRTRRRAMDDGVTLTDPQTVYFSHDTQWDADCTIGPHVLFGTGVVLKKNVHILGFCSLAGSVIHAGARIGPFAHLRPGTIVGNDAKIGNFVELKKTTLGAGSKINHLSYVGDAVVGAHVNIGAGTITCNYDGYHKYKTIIDDNVFVGSNTALVAPVHIHANAMIAAGSVITSDVPSGALGIARNTQHNKNQWADAFRTASQQEKK